MTDTELFTRVGIREMPTPTAEKKEKFRGFPWLSAGILGAITLCCLFAEVLMTHDPGYLDLQHFSVAPCREFLFGTDPLGRDIFSGIWYGGRISITIGLLSTLISTAVAMIYGALSGIAPRWLDGLMMRFAEVFLSIPNLLLVLFFQAILGQASVFSLSLVLGLTGWASMAKVIRTEVQQLRSSDYVVACKCMGGGFFHLLWQHLAPNFIASIMFMVVMAVRGAIVSESTLSFLGMGLSLDTVSWGSLLSQSEKALMSGAWWVILIPGAFLVTLLLCLTNIGNYLRASATGKERIL